MARLHLWKAHLGSGLGEAAGRPLPQSRRRGQSSAPVDGLKRCLTLKPLAASQVTHTQSFQGAVGLWSVLSFPRVGE